jgi:hypothetical protein
LNHAALFSGTIEVTWPIDDVIQRLHITSPRRLSRLEAMVFAAVHATGALTRSCASDLFRTASLKRFPFPTEFGTAGDGIWGIQHAAQVSWGVVPGCFSTFLLHATTLSQAENRTRPGAARCDAILKSAVQDWRREGLVSDEQLGQIGWARLVEALTGFLDKALFDRQRKSRLPWILNLGAWRARARRQRHLATLRACKDLALPTALKVEELGTRAAA